MHEELCEGGFTYNIMHNQSDHQFKHCFLHTPLQSPWLGATQNIFVIMYIQYK